MALEGLHLGQYRLLHLLGSGGMGEVYLAEDARINQQVAIKISRAETSSYPNNSTTGDTVRLFQREARAIARLDHPNILPLFSYGEEKVNGMTLIYIVMPYRREGSFVNWLQQHGANAMLSVQDIAYFIHQAADALQYAHDNQIVHQDVKPSNFLIRMNNQHPKLPDLLLADFGIARWSSSNSNSSLSIRGTPTYMAPEQWSGKSVYATDQYALAILAYELLAGRPPFIGRMEQVMYQHIQVQPQSPSTFNPQLSQDLNAIILKALAKKPEERFPSISAFAADFQQATVGLDASTIITTLSILQGTDLHATLAISKDEAQKGTSRLLTFPGGRQISVSVPAGAYNGQVLQFPGVGEPFNKSGQASTLILTLSIQETGEQASSGQHSVLDRTVPVSNSTNLSKTIASPGESYMPVISQPSALTPEVAEAHHHQPVLRPHGISTGTAVLLVGLAFLIIVGAFGFFYLANINRSSPNTTNSAATTQNGGTTGLAATSTTQTNNTEASATASASNIATATITAQSSNYVQLKSYYIGTASGYADGSITFTLKSEDQQGNVSMQTTFQQLGASQKTAIYSCQGSVTTDRHINLLNLQCSNVADPSYILIIQGYVYPDGHMDGTETATNTNDPSYKHVYLWRVS